jgi:hypothetical protein
MKNDVELIPSKMTGLDEMTPDDPEGVSLIKTYIHDTNYNIPEIEIKKPIHTPSPSVVSQNTQNSTEQIKIDNKPIQQEPQSKPVDKEIPQNSQTVNNSGKQNLIV